MDRTATIFSSCRACSPILRVVRYLGGWVFQTSSWLRSSTRIDCTAFARGCESASRAREGEKQLELTLVCMLEGRDVVSPHISRLKDAPTSPSEYWGANRME